MKVKILTGKYEGMSGETGKVDTSEGYPWLEVILDLNKSSVWVGLDQVEEM